MQNDENIYLEKTRILYNDWYDNEGGDNIPKKQATINALKDYVKGEVMQGDKQYAEQGIDITIILGADYEVFLVK